MHVHFSCVHNFYPARAPLPLGGLVQTTFGKFSIIVAFKGGGGRLLDIMPSFYIAEVMLEGGVYVTMRLVFLVMVWTSPLG